MVKYYSPPIISHTYISLSSNYPDLNLSFLRSDRECPRVSCFPDSPPFDRHHCQPRRSRPSRGRSHIRHSTGVLAASAASTSVASAGLAAATAARQAVAAISAVADAADAAGAAATSTTAQQQEPHWHPHPHLPHPHPRIRIRRTRIRRTRICRIGSRSGRNSQKYRQADAVICSYVSQPASSRTHQP